MRKTPLADLDFSNGGYPPGTRRGPHQHRTVTAECPNGHEWEARIYDELGGTFYVDCTETCPRCGEEDVER